MSSDRLLDFSGWELRKTLQLLSMTNPNLSDWLLTDKVYLNDSIKALRNRHPFRGFRSALDWNGLTDEWYAYRDSRMEDYVKSEMI